jgi:5-methylcytosine-specific restriction protein A
VPTLPKRLCPRCRKAVDGRCVGCGKRSQQEADGRRGTARERGYDATWERFRVGFLSEHPLCEDCLEAGKYEPATEVHHIRKVRDFPELRLDPTNCRALSHACHSVRTRRGE